MLHRPAQTGYAQNLTSDRRNAERFLIFFSISSFARLFRSYRSQTAARNPRLDGNVKGRDTHEFGSLRNDHIQLIRARELNRMKEATDYAGPPIAVRRWWRLRFNRSSESKFKCNGESRRNSLANSYANDRRFFCVHPEKLLLSTICWRSKFDILLASESIELRYR